MSSMRSYLTELSSEAVDVLSLYLDAADLVCLLFTGYKRLILTLEERVRLTSTKTLLRRDLKHWPAFFSRHKRLQTLSVQFARHVASPNEHLLNAAHLLALPRTLRSIQLGMPSAERAWILGDSMAFEIATEFPELQHLTLCGVSAWKNVHLAFLPPILRTLRLPNNTAITQAGVRMLPQGLEVLDLAMAPHVFSVDLELPKELHTLTICNNLSHQHPKVEEYFATLARVKHLEITQNGRVMPLYEYIHYLPSNLRSFTAPNWSYTAYSHIPDWPFSSMTTLRLRGPQILIPFIDILPDSLTFLEIGLSYELSSGPYCIPEEYHIGRHQGLTRVGTSTYLNSSILRKLPPHLTHLDLGVYLNPGNITPNGACNLKQPHFFQDIQSLPSSLTYLQLLINPEKFALYCRGTPLGNDGLELYNVLAYIPPNVRFLHLPSVPINHSKLRLLPPNICTVNFRDIIIDDSFIQNLPEIWAANPKLKFGGVLNRRSLISAAETLLPAAWRCWSPVPWKIELTSNSLGHMPLMVKHVDVDSIQPEVNQPPTTTISEHLIGITLPSASSFWNGPKWDYETSSYITDSIVTLPPGLLFLDLPKDSSTMDIHISFLPRTLTFLRLAWNENITDEGVADLPPNLLFLDLSYNTLITGAAIPDLPRSLTHLSLWINSNVHDEAIPNLPTGLKSLQLARAPLTAKAFSSLPPQLEELEVNPISFEGIEVDLMPKTLKKIVWKWTIALRLQCQKLLPNLHWGYAETLSALLELEQAEAKDSLDTGARLDPNSVFFPDASCLVTGSATSDVPQC